LECWNLHCSECINSDKSQRHSLSNAHEYCNNETKQWKGTLAKLIDTLDEVSNKQSKNDAMLNNQAEQNEAN